MFWFLSFADGRRPKGTQFLGGAIVEAQDFMAAIKKTHALGINPGGEVQGTGPSITVDSVGEELNKKYSNRLLTREECVEWDEAADGHVKNVQLMSRA